METLTSNLTGKVRRAELHGRAYLVAPLSMIVPGVLHGSKGPLYYPPEEIARNVDAWNGMPIVVYHPERNGQPVSARSPEILETQAIGTVFKATYNGKLSAEGWFDEERTRSVDDRILESLLSGKPLELSTGLYTDNDVAAENAKHNGKAYSFVARNYRPDHLAVFADRKGACSIADGCGVMVNEAEQAMEPEQKTLFQTAIQAVVNAFCPTGEGGGIDPTCGGGKGGGSTGGRGSTSLKEASSRAGGLSSDANAKSKSAKTRVQHSQASAAHQAASDAHNKAADIAQSAKHAGANPDYEAGKYHLKLAKQHSRKSIKHSIKSNQVSNQLPSTKEATMAKSKDELIDSLIANCECWGEDDREVLNDMEDEKLEALVKDSENHKQEAEVANAARKGFNDPGGNQHVFNEKTKQWESKTPTNNAFPPKKEVEDEDELTPEEKAKMKKKGKKAPAMNMDEWKAAAPPEVQEVFNESAQIVEERKAEIVQKLVGNIKDDTQRQVLGEKLMKLSRTELQDRLELAQAYAANEAANTPAPKRQFNFSGQGAPANNAAPKDDAADDILEIPTINYAEMAAQRKQA